MRGELCRVVVVATLLACDDLPAVQNDVCGNQVVDPTEDCDTFAAGAGTFCGLPNTADQCRYICGLQRDGTTTYVCPPQMGCGTDGVCRAATGTFAPGTQPIAGTFADILVGDVDGDHRDDVVGLEAGDTSLSFFDGTLANTATVRSPRGGVSLLHPLLRDISGDGLADLLEGVGGGTLVDLGSSTRTFLPTACPSTTVPTVTAVRIIPLKALPDKPGEQVFIMASALGYSGILLLQSTGVGGLFTALPRPATDLAGPVVVGKLNEDLAQSPCDELALAYANSQALSRQVGEVDVYTSCKSDGMGGFEYNTNATPTRVALSGKGMQVVRGPLLLDVNNDGHLDFLVGAAACPGCDEVQVAYGVGDGTFQSSSGANTFATYPLVTGPLPLAMGDLNGDGVPDQVTPTSISVSHVGTTVTFTQVALAPGVPWTEAVIADFTHDGIPDVAAGSSAAPNIDFFEGVGDGQGTLNPFVIQSAAVQNLTVGDYDGDLVNDLAVTELGGNDPLGDSVSVLWGNAVGALSPPVSMGRFVDMQQIATGKFADNAGILSGVSGLFTVAVPDANNTNLGSFAGSGDRVLRSPLEMSVLTSTTMPALASEDPWRFAYGQFTSATGAEVAAIDQQAFPTTSTPVNRLWFLPTDGEGRFVTTNVAIPTLVPDGLDWTQVAIAAVDLAGGGTDQVVAFGPSMVQAGQGAFAIALPTTASNGAVSLTFGPVTSIPALVSHVEANTTQSQTGRLLVDDLDGDGHRDLVVVATIAETQGATPSPHVVVFWNDLGGQLGPMTVIPNPGGQSTVDFTLVNVGRALPDIALLTSAGVSLVSFMGRIPNAATTVNATGGSLIATGDIDGDGVADLVVAGATGFVVYRGQPVHS